MTGALRRAVCAVLLLVAAAALPGTPALAVEPDEVLADPALEARARALSKQLRCVVCQNQSIDDSNAELARDFRLLVRERLVAGDSDQQVLDFFVARYGDYVLLEPRLRLQTTPLWLGPPIVLVLALIGVFVWYRSSQQRVSTDVAPLTAEERARLDALVDRLGRDDAADPPRSPPADRAT